jgi:hypothetical protein
MITLRWDHRQARAWLGELPDWVTEEVEVIERHLEARAVRSWSSNHVAVELYIPVGGFVANGALGATFVPRGSGRLDIQVSVSNPAGQPYATSLARSVDTVWLGIAPEFVGDILCVAADAGSAELLGAGTLRFSCGAHGVVGSSPWLFQVLTRLVIGLLARETHLMSQPELVSMFTRELERPPIRHHG